MKKFQPLTTATVQLTNYLLLIKNFLKEQKKILKEAYSVYSGFSVGASALLDNGEIIAANNQENIAYPSSMCAESSFYFCKANYPNCIIEKLLLL